MSSSLLLKVTIVTLVAGCVTWLLLGFFGVQALFMDRTVNEEVPLLVAPLEVPPSSSTTTPQTPTASNDIIHATSTPALPPPIAARLLAQGSFQEGDRTYTIHGKATVSEQDGIRTLALTDFDVTNGPDLFVYIVSAQDVQNETVKNAVREKRFMNLGGLKGNRGNQTYLIPPEVTLDDQSVISIWCRRFFRNFGSADLRLIR